MEASMKVHGSAVCSGSTMEASRKYQVRWKLSAFHGMPWKLRYKYIEVVKPSVEVRTTDCTINTTSYSIIKIKIHSSCEIEDFVETHLCKLCVILRLRVLGVMCPH